MLMTQVMTCELAHTPVLLDATLTALNVRADGLYVDATFGRGGHSAAILERLGSRGRVIALDRDPEAVTAGRQRFRAESRLTLLHGEFGALQYAVRQVLGAEREWRSTCNGVLFDLGVSSPQLDDAARGFSFMQDGPLDMRMDNERGMTAADWLAIVSERELAETIRKFGEERFARRIARAIVQARAKQPIARTAQLAALVAEAVPTREPGKHPATRTFQAIRMRINRELEQLDSALKQSIELLAPQGRLCVISFHSLEDRLVKQFMQRHSSEDPMYAGLPHLPAHARPTLKRIGRAIRPSAAEVAANPRARSAILRVAERLAA